VKHLDQILQLLIRSAELRNYVYKFAAEQSISVELLHDPSHSTDNIDYAEQDCKLLGLTQTCRQIRAEFLPVYLEKTTVAFPYDQVDQYVSTFVDPQDGTYEDAVGKVIMLRPIIRATRSFVDILPFIKLIARAPRFTASFAKMDSSSFDYIPLYNTLLNNHHNPQWDLYVSTSLSQVNIRIDEPVFRQVTIVVKKESVEGWMRPEQRPKGLTEQYLATRAWCIRVGLDGDDYSPSHYLFLHGIILLEDSAASAQLSRD
jgi:hypothetical protein